MFEGVKEKWNSLSKTEKGLAIGIGVTGVLAAVGIGMAISNGNRANRLGKLIDQHADVGNTLVDVVNGNARASNRMAEALADHINDHGAITNGETLTLLEKLGMVKVETVRDGIAKVRPLVQTISYEESILQTAENARRIAEQAKGLAEKATEQAA